MVACEAMVSREVRGLTIYRIKMTALILISLFFLAAGVDLLISAYRLNDPFTFIMVFFASNLMILISAALCLGFVLRLKRSFAGPATPDNPDDKDFSEKP